MSKWYEVICVTTTSIAVEVENNEGEEEAKSAALDEISCREGDDEVNSWAEIDESAARHADIRLKI